MSIDITFGCFFRPLKIKGRENASKNAFEKIPKTHIRL